jgi:hypothetical protein
MPAGVDIRPHPMMQRRHRQQQPFGSSQVGGGGGGGGDNRPPNASKCSSAMHPRTMTMLLTV